MRSNALPKQTRGIRRNFHLLGFGLCLYTLGSKVVPASDLALLSMTEVVLGPFWVWLLLGETASQFTLLGGAILLAAIAGNAVTQLRHRPPPLAL